VLRPAEDAFERLATRGNLIPVVREILADLDTPLSLFRRLDDGRTTFLFESVQGGEKWARYSFIGTGARAIFRARGRSVEWEEGGRTERMIAPGDPLALLRERLSKLRPVALSVRLVVPFGHFLPTFTTVRAPRPPTQARTAPFEPTKPPVAANAPPLSATNNASDDTTFAYPDRGRR